MRGGVPIQAVFNLLEVMANPQAFKEKLEEFERMEKRAREAYEKASELQARVVLEGQDATREREALAMEKEALTAEREQLVQLNDSIVRAQSALEKAEADLNGERNSWDETFERQTEEINRRELAVTEREHQAKKAQERADALEAEFREKLQRIRAAAAV